MKDFLSVGFLELVSQISLLEYLIWAALLFFLIYSILFVVV
ncbi:MAG: Uncharacterised protein [Flavobacteriaceae bacterium]|nr:MAG: Uncharacterised protein [Flavobacteriaceae bacterium]